MLKRVLYGLALILLCVLAFVFGTFKVKRFVELPAADWTQGSEAATAWREFTASQEAGAAKIYAATDNPLERREGLKFLSSLASMSIEMKIAKGDRARPAFTDWMGDDRKLLGDSPDAIYHTAEISPDYSYEITGNIGEAEYLGFALYGRQVNGWNRAAGNLSHTDMEIDADGNFRVVLSRNADQNETHSLVLEDDIHMVMVRQYFHDRPSKTPATFSIRNLTPPTPTAQTDTELAGYIREAVMFFNDSLDGTIALGNMLQDEPNSATPPKKYDPDFGGVFYPTHDNQYFGTGFKLAPDEALIIEGEAPDADYWSISLQNRWLQSLSYDGKPVSLDNHQLTIKDGRYRVIVAHENPGPSDWLNTSGHTTGLVAIRYQLADTVPSPEILLAKLNDLKE